MQVDAFVARSAVWLAVVALAAAASVGAARGEQQQYFPDVTLVTQDGVRVRLYDDLIKGKIVAINLIYTSCQYACPLETARLAQVYKRLGDRMGREVFFYSITIDPERDTPAVLKAYAEKYRTGPGWLFLTGTQADIDLISKKLGLYSPANPSNPDGHTPSLLVGNETTGQWMRNFALSNPASIARTIGDWLTSWRGVGKAPVKSYADAARPAVSRGEYVFATRCAACHTIGGGELLGPDLRGVTTRRDRAWLERFILAPEKMLAAGDPIALALRDQYKPLKMPNLFLEPGEVDILIDYIAAQGGRR